MFLLFDLFSVPLKLKIINTCVSLGKIHSTITLEWLFVSWCPCNRQNAGLLGIRIQTMGFKFVCILELSKGFKRY